MTIYLGNTLRYSSSDRTQGSAGRFFPLYSALLRAGFAWHIGYPTPGGLLPHLFTLTFYCEKAVFFCGTFLWFAPTGRYPALCPMEPGLSSTPKGAAAI